METTESKLLEGLEHYFGYSAFRHLQLEAIQSILAKKDTLLILPTGGGKSICFQLPALVGQRLCLVVSPLISLMNDQVQALRKNGIEAAFINSSVDAAEAREIEEKAIAKKIQLIYVSPEKLMSDATILQRLPVQMLAIDEAHCISQWGHDFRPEYSQMGFVKKQYPDLPIIALTATADKATRQDMKEQLGIPNAEEFLGSFNRENLYLEVRSGLSAKEKYNQLEKLIKTYPNDSGIIYCLSRKNTESVADQLTQRGIKAGVYHAGLPNEERSSIQDDFINDRKQVICATIAFGMGIDKSNVRYVVHYNLPKTIESFYQEIGRAGRDGLPAQTRLYYSYGDIKMLTMFANQGKQAAVNLEKLNRMKQYALSDICRRKILLNYFGESSVEDCGNCDVCKSPRKHFDGTVVGQKALSALYRMNQKAGFNLLIDVLRGSSKAEIMDQNFHLIKTYGAGREFSFFEWQHYLNQMLHLGIIEIAYTESFALKITDLGLEVLYGKRPLKLTIYTADKEIAESAKDATKKVKKTKRTGEPGKGDLFELLRTKRKEIAEKEGSPPYVIFHDRSLHDMTVLLPLFVESMAEVEGVGAHKLRKYGQVFLNEIRKYVLENELSSTKKYTYLTTLNAYQEGKTLEEMATIKEVTTSTIVSHLCVLLAQGEKIDITKFVNKSHIELVKRSIIYLDNYQSLSSIKEHLGDGIEFDTIRLAIAYLLFKGQLKSVGGEGGL